MPTRRSSGHGPPGKRWILHIGAPKTGSTAIQRFLFDHRDALLRHGIHYPNVSLRGFGHHDLAFLLHGRYAAWATPQSRPLDEWCGVLRDLVRATPATTTVLSSEIFYLYPKPAALRALLEQAGLAVDDEVRVVCYVRRQDDAQLSWYNQTVKAQGNADGFATTCARDRDLWRYDERLRPWQEAFGARALMIRDYTPFGRPEHDIRADFLDILGLPRGLFALPPARINERINRDILEFQRRVNRLPLPPRQKRRYHKSLIELTAASADWGVFDDTPFLTVAARRALLQDYEAGNAALARDHLGGVTLFEPVVDEPAPPRTVRGGLTIAKIVRILAWIAGRRDPPSPMR